MKSGTKYTFNCRCKRFGPKCVWSVWSDVEFYCEKDQLDVDAVFRAGTDTRFSPTAFDDSEIGGSEENPILLDEEEDNENSPPTTQVFEKQTRPPALLRNCPFGTRIEKDLHYVYRSLFQKVLPCVCFDVIFNSRVSFYHNLFQNEVGHVWVKSSFRSISLVLLVAASCCINQAHTENKVGRHNEIKRQGPCENEYRKWYLNGGECFFLVDEDFVGCKCTWL